jgi:general stress protein 26
MSTRSENPMSRDQHLKDSHTSEEERAELYRKIEKVRFGMLATRADDGSLSSRPMTLQGVDDDGTMWFFTAGSTQLGDDVRREPRVNVSFADIDDDFYLSASGTGSFVDDREKIEALWGTMAAAWFDSPADPKLWLLRVIPERVDYWKSGAGKVLQMVAMLKAAMTNTRPGEAVGRHGSFEPS